ncbi:MAG TPA: hypothetical protein VGN97_23375 [Mesorhizobium sp.]|jgi:hypothetical protein|nr:hypothetical protein [Mesorhizobium sp.]
MDRKTSPAVVVLASAVLATGVAAAQERRLPAGDRHYALNFSDELRLVRSAPANATDRTAAWEFESEDWRLDARGKFGVSLGVIESADRFEDAVGHYNQSFPGLNVSLSPTTLFVDGQGFHIFVAPSRCAYPCTLTVILGYDETHAALGEETARRIKADLEAGDFLR